MLSIPIFGEYENDICNCIEPSPQILFALAPSFTNLNTNYFNIKIINFALICWTESLAH